MTPVLLVGVGNDYRGDDAAGLAVARRLKAMRLPGVAVVEATGDGASLLDVWQGHEHVVIVDAVSSGAVPGTVHRFDAHAKPIPMELFRSSTHAFGLADAIELARAMGQLPQRLVVYGIEGRRFEVGAGLSEEVERVVHGVVEHIARELATHQGVRQR
ncbi:MAG: hydrogenase maturation protease [Chloroflexota bacterium]|nr:hydrogenase maturation protease [Chloroflexota bacterium]